MPRVSDRKRTKIQEQIAHFLFSIAPSTKFTNEIAHEMARDEEFTKILLTDLAKKKIIVPISKNKDGKVFLKRQRWRLSNEAYEIYKQRQTFQGFQISEEQL